MKLPFTVVYNKDMKKHRVFNEITITIINAIKALILKIKTKIRRRVNLRITTNRGIKAYVNN